MNVLPYHDTLSLEPGMNAKFRLELKNEKKAKVARKVAKAESNVNIVLLRAEHTLEAAKFSALR